MRRRRKKNERTATTIKRKRRRKKPTLCAGIDRQGIELYNNCKARILNIS
jgi:hypothetical protein